MKTYLVGEQVNDLKRMLQDPDSHQFLAVVSSVHHQRVGDTLDDGALGLAETFGGIPTSTVGQVDSILLLDWQVIL